MGRCKWRVDDVRGEGNHGMGLENQVKKTFQGDISVVNVDASERWFIIIIILISIRLSEFRYLWAKFMDIWTQSLNEMANYIISSVITYFYVRYKVPDFLMKRSYDRKEPWFIHLNEYCIVNLLNINRFKYASPDTLWVSWEQNLFKS